MTFLVGVLSILMGLVAEMLVRTYFELQGARAYLVRELIIPSASSVSKRLRQEADVRAWRALSAPAISAIVSAMAELIRHRGPDGNGLSRR